MSALPAQFVSELLRRFAAALRSGQLYSRGHPIIARNLESLSVALQLVHGLEPSIVLAIVGEEIIVNEVPVSKSEAFGGLVRLLKKTDVERITIDRGVAPDEIATLVDAVATLGAAGEGPHSPFPSLPHIRVGQVSVEPGADPSGADMAAFRALYSEAMGNAEVVWESAHSESQPDATVARTMVDGLAQAVSQNRSALLALTTLRNYDNYTFTHMVNVSILTMGQARGLGIEGPLLREFGLAALMHDIGKVRTPPEILNKAEGLTDAEAAIMKRHTVDGAELLRATPDIPILAPVVAFEHHLRLDGGGYPVGARRRTLNLGTMLCSIADVYDAMRSKRKYQQSSPTDRILEVLKGNDGRAFNAHLVRRFSQLIGIYPVGNLVRLDSGEIAVVTKVYAPDPYRPHVKILTTSTGARLESPSEARLWEERPGQAPLPAIVAALDPTEVGIDPLTFV